jgi:hypothetical protein
MRRKVGTPRLRVQSGAMMRRVTFIVVGVFAPVLAWAESAPLPAPATATAMWNCIPAAGVAIRALPGCNYGVPVRAGDKLLVPRACRLQVAEKTVERHTIEIRLAATGASVGQASLPAAGAVSTASLPVPGIVLPATPMLYAWPGGLAALDLATRTLEPALAPDGTLLAVAVRGDRVVVVEGSDASKWQVTALDLEHESVIGEATVQAPPPNGLAWTAAGDAVEVTVAGTNSWSRLIVTLPTGAPQGPPPPLSIRRLAVPAPRPASAPNCPWVPARDATVFNELAPMPSNPSVITYWAAPDQGARLNGGGDRCTAVVAADATGRAFAWTATASGPQLRPVTCTRQ